jgi:hypothetical protein
MYEASINSSAFMEYIRIVDPCDVQGLILISSFIYTFPSIVTIDDAESSRLDWPITVEW